MGPRTRASRTDRARRASGLLLLGGLCAAAQPLRFDHVLTIGSKTGLNPAQRLTGRLAKTVFGPPEKISPLVAPDSVTADAEQRVWITDRGAPAVHMFDLLGGGYKVLRGGGEIAFQCPSGIDTDVHGRIYVADACLGQVFVFEKTGEFLRLLFGKRPRFLQRPTGLAVSRDLRSIYVTDSPRHKVVVLNQEGETVREWGDPEQLKQPTALALDEERIFVLNGRAVEVFSPGGAHLKSLAWGAIREPSAFAFDAERRLFFVGDPKYELVQVFQEDGRWVGAFGQSGAGSSELHGPAALYIDSSGRIYVVDSANAKVLVFCEAPGPAATAPAQRP